MAIELRDYQKEIVSNGKAILDQYNILYLALEVRVGKTLTALAIAEQYKYNNVLFLTKKKAIASIEKDYQLLKPDYRITITNYEQVPKLKPEYDLIIIDEAQNFGTFPRPSKRTLTTRKLCIGKPIIFLSGTPSPESYSQLYHQFSLSSFSPLKQYTNFYKFAYDFVSIKIKYLPHPVKDYSNCNGDRVWQLIKHLFIRFTQEEAGFEAPVDEHILMVEMSDESKRIYKELENHKIYSTHFPNPANIAATIEVVATVNSGGDLINKLAQISSGTLIFDDIAKGFIIDPAKAYYIRNFFFGKKIAISYRYKSEFELLQKFFPNWTDSPEVFNAERDRTFLGQVQSSREGVNLSTADALVMYNIDFSATSYFQMRARIQSKERKGSAPMYWVFSTHGIERKIHKAVTNKNNFTYSYYKKHVRETSTV